MARLLLLHGFTGAPSSWDAVVDALPPGHSVLRPWLTGHGRPSAALEVASFDDEVERLLGLVPDDDVALVAGYSLGARLALALLVKAPRRFSAGILVSGRAGLDTDVARRDRQHADAALVRRLESAGLESFVEHWQGLPLFSSQERLPPALREAEHARRTAHSAAGLAHSLAVTGLGQMPNLWEELATLATPLEVLAGELDPDFCALGEAIVGKALHARFTCVQGAGHNLLLEQPESVARAISRGLEA